MSGSKRHASEEHGAFLLDQLLSDNKKLISNLDLAKFYSIPQGRVTNKAHSLLSLSPACEKINYGPTLNYVVDPPSSGILNFLLKFAGEDSDNNAETPSGPSLHEVIASIFDDSAFHTVV